MSHDQRGNHRDPAHQGAISCQSRPTRFPTSRTWRRIIFPDNIAVTGVLPPIGIVYHSDLVSKPPSTGKSCSPTSRARSASTDMSNSLGFMFVLLIANSRPIPSRPTTAFTITKLKTIQPGRLLRHNGDRPITARWRWRRWISRPFSVCKNAACSRAPKCHPRAWSPSTRCSTSARAARARGPGVRLGRLHPAASNAAEAGRGLLRLADQPQDRHSCRAGEPRDRDCCRAMS